MIQGKSQSIATLLLAASLATVSAPPSNGAGDQPPKPPSGARTDKDFKFEVLSIKPIQRGPGVSLGIPQPSLSGFSARAMLSQVVMYAYGLPCPISLPLCAPEEIRNPPNWINDIYAFDARVSQADLAAWRNQGSNFDPLRSALRTALKERCKLILHKEPKQEPIVEIVLAKGGSRLKATKPGAALPTGAKLESGGVLTSIDHGRGGVFFHGATIQDLADFLSRLSSNGPVRDHTLLTGRYDFALRVTEVAGPPDLDSLPLGELGLKLRLGKEDRPALVIDRMERPSPN